MMIFCLADAMSVDGEGSLSVDSVFIGSAEFLLTISMMSLTTGGSSLRVDQPLSISLGKFGGIGVAKPEVYFSNLNRVAYLPAPSIMPAHLFDTSMVFGKGIVTGRIPGRLIAPFS